MKLLKKEVFDINKVTVVGSPTITSDGVASGFDGANANNIQIPTAIISQIATANTWKVEVGGTIQESGSIYSNVRSDNNQRYDLIQLNRYDYGFIFVCCLDENGATVSKNIPITFSNEYNNKVYKATLEFTGTKYIATVQFGDGEVLTNSLDSTYKIKFFNYGDKFELGYKCINGSIDLSSFKIYVDGQEIYNTLKPSYLMEKRKEGFDLSKFTVVGSPTITDDGVINEITSSNYLIADSFAFGGTSWSIKARIKPVANPKDDKWQAIFCDQNSREKQLSFFVNRSGNRLGVLIRSADDTSNLYSNEVFGNINKDELQEVELRYENKTLSSYADGVKKMSYSIDLDDRVFNNKKIVGMAFGSQAFYGIIYLPTLSVTSNGKEVFTGAKENYYIFK